MNRPEGEPENHPPDNGRYSRRKHVGVDYVPDTNQHWGGDPGKVKAWSVGCLASRARSHGSYLTWEHIGVVEPDDEFNPNNLSKL